MADLCRPFQIGKATLHPLFSVSVASKGFTSAVSLVFAETCGGIHKCCS